MLCTAGGPYARAGTWLAVAWLGGISLAAALASVLPLAEGRDPALTLTEPNLASPDFLSNHPLGTDTLGLDILAQLLYGARVSLTVAFGASILAFLVGTAVGMFAGYTKGLADQVIGFFTDCILSFPALILLLAMVTFLKPSLLNITIALGVLAVPGYVRLARASTLTVSSREFVIASQTLGASNARILFRNLLPNVVPPLIAYSLIVMSFLIVAEASLSYLGLGIQRPNPTWGNLIAQGQTYLETNPTLVLIPSAALFLTVMAANYLGQRLQSRQGLA
jgi:peptide/nickel transport system permease protein